MKLTENQLDDLATDITEKALGLREDYRDPAHYDRDFSARFNIERAKLASEKPYSVTIERTPDNWFPVPSLDIPQVVLDFAEAGNEGYIDDGDTHYCVIQRAND